MKKKIQDIIQGKFESEMPYLLVPDGEIAFQVIENEIYEGEFCLESSREAVRGIVTCSNPNITCLTDAFDGKKINVSFTYDAGQLLEGDEDSGQFVITSSAGEYLIPFRAGITKQYLKSSIGRIKTLNDFTNLAKLNWEEALRVFQSPHFCNIFHEQADFCALLYRGITEKTKGSHEMEEFLIGSGKKRRNRFSAEEKPRVYRVGSEALRDTIVIQKSDWGFVQAELSCDAEFIRLSKTRIQMQDFVGKHAEISYEILPGRMHGGKNYAVITVWNCFQKQKITVIAEQNGQRTTPSPAAPKKEIRFALVRKYMEFLMGYTDEKSWREETAELLHRLRELDARNPWAQLFAVYISLVGEKKEKADRELAAVSKTVRSQRSPLGAFYLYLTTLEESDEAYIRDVTVRVREIFLKYPGHPVLAWILLQIDEALLRNPERKYHMLKKYMTEYSRSPVFYLEGAKLLHSHPELFYKQDIFEKRLIYWMAKHGLLEEALALRVLNLAQSMRQFEPTFFWVLGRCCRLLQTDTAVKAVCAYLIKMNRYGEAYFPWFQRGVQQHLKIAGLYEAYMMSWSKADGALPREIIKYFSMNSRLPAKRKALLFSYVVRNRERLGRDWDAYMVLVKNFAVRELEKDHMSEDLAVIYEAVKKQMPTEEWQEKKGEAESSYRVHTDGEAITAIRVLQRESSRTQRVAVYQNGGYIHLYRRPFVLLYEDAQGNIYAAKDRFRLRKMISGEHIYAPEPQQKIPVTLTERMQKKQSLQARLEAFAGSLREMQQLIEEAADAGIEILPFQEQLLVRMLFTGKFLPGHEELFVRVSQDEQAAAVSQAYVSWFSRKYLTEDLLLPAPAVLYIEAELRRRKHLNAFCELAFLKAFANTPKEAWKEPAEQILKKYLLCGVWLDFYEKLPEQMRRRYLLFGIRVIQYCGRPGETLYITRTPGRREQLREVLPGIYAMRVDLFPGEEVTYRIFNPDNELLREACFRQDACEDGFKKTRYGCVSSLFTRIPDSRAQYEYAELCDLTEVLFEPIEE